MGNIRINKSMIIGYSKLIGYSRGMIQGILTWDNLTDDQIKILNRNLDEISSHLNEIKKIDNNDK